jgi:N-acylneuraminate cytidylyltransferase
MEYKYYALPDVSLALSGGLVDGSSHLMPPTPAIRVDGRRERKGKWFQMSYKTVAIIPARGGSKGIPGKNIIDFCGKPLIAWTIECALHVKEIENVYVSTDDLEIMLIAQDYGAEVIPRPNDLATDTAQSEEAILHIIKDRHLEDCELIVMLQCTSPIRESSDIEKGLNMIKSYKGLDSCFSTSLLNDFYIWNFSKIGARTVNYDYKNRSTRQEFERSNGCFCVENGSIYIFKVNTFLKEKNRICGQFGFFHLPLWKSFEIDDIDNLDLCGMIFKEKLLNNWNK